MTKLSEALAVLAGVDFKQTIPATEQARISAFLESALIEVQQREEAVAKREADVSQRESNAELRESDIRDRVATLASMTRLRQALVVKPIATFTERRRWFKH